MVLPWQGKARQEAGATSKFTFPIRLGGADGRCTLLAAYCCKTGVALIRYLSLPTFLIAVSFSLSLSPCSGLFRLPLHWLLVQFLLQLTFWQHRIGDFASFVSVARVAILPRAQWWRIGRSENGCENLRVQKKWRSYTALCVEMRCK